MNASDLPSVVPHLKNGDEAVFIKPRSGQELRELHTEKNKISPVATVLGGRVLTLQRNHVVPVHVNLKFEKLLFQLKGVLSLLRFQDTKPIWTDLDAGESVIIPAGTPHALFVYWVAKGNVQSETLIVKAGQENDAIWEPDMERLIRNEH